MTMVNVLMDIDQLRAIIQFRNEIGTEVLRQVAERIMIRENLQVFERMMSCNEPYFTEFSHLCSHFILK